MSRFTDAIEHYCEGLTVAPGAASCCDDCRDLYGCDDGMTENEAQEYLCDHAEPWFSWQPCDSCGSRFGGDREAAHGLPIDARGALDYSRDMLHMAICVDCLMFWANGEEPERWAPSP